MGQLGNILYQGLSSAGRNIQQNKRWQAVQEAAQKEIERQEKEQERELKEENDKLNMSLKAIGTSPAVIESLSLGEKKGMLESAGIQGMRKFLGVLNSNAQTAANAPGVASPQAHADARRLQANPMLATQVDYFDRTGQVAGPKWQGLLAGPERREPIEFKTDPETGARFARLGKSMQQVQVKGNKEVDLTNLEEALQGAERMGVKYSDAEVQEFAKAFVERAAKGSPPSAMEVFTQLTLAPMLAKMQAEGNLPEGVSYAPPRKTEPTAPTAPAAVNLEDPFGGIE